MGRMRKISILGAVMTAMLAAVPASARECTLRLVPTNYVVAQSVSSDSVVFSYSSLPNAASFAETFAPDNQAAILENLFADFELEGYDFKLERAAPIPDVLNFRQSSPPLAGGSSGCTIEVITREIKIMRFALTGQTASWIYIVRIFGEDAKPSYKVMRGIGGKIKPRKDEEPSFTTGRAVRLIEDGLPEIRARVAEGLAKTFAKGSDD